MFRAFFTFLILAAANPVLAAETRLLEVKVEGKTLFYVEIEPSGQVYKAYPKPRAPLGQYRKAATGNKVSFFPAKTVSNEDLFWITSANIANASALGPEPLAVFRALILESAETELISEESPDKIQPEKWTGPAVKLDWSDVVVVPVTKEERTKIDEFEKALQGEWKLDRMTDWLGEQKTNDVTQYKTIKFCADGKCVCDKDDKFYWVDGKYLRLNMNAEPEWEKYSFSEEYDLEQVSPTEIVIRPIDAETHPPSRHKFKEWEETYPADKLKRAYYFKRVPPHP